MQVLGFFLFLADILNHHGTIFAGILSNFAHGNFQRFADNIDTGLGIFIVHLESVKCSHGIDQGHTAARDDTFFNSRAGGRKSIFNAVFLFFQFSFGCCTNTDDGNTAG